MFGPVINNSRGALSPPASSFNPFAVKPSPLCFSAASTTGWRRPSASKTGASTNCGLTAPTSCAQIAVAAATSNAASAFANSPSSTDCASTRSVKPANKASSLAFASSSAREIRPANSASSLVEKRTLLASVWRWMKVSLSGGAIILSLWRAETSTKYPSTLLYLIFNDEIPVSAE